MNKDKFFNFFDEEDIKNSLIWGLVIGIVISWTYKWSFVYLITGFCGGTIATLIYNAIAKTIRNQK